MTGQTMVPRDPKVRTAAVALGEAIEKFMHVAWDANEEMIGVTRPYLNDFVVTVHLREVDDDGTVHDQYALVRPTGQAMHITKGLLNEGIDTAIEESEE